MICKRSAIALCLVLTVPALCRAGLYYSGEPMAELPSQWRGFLLDQRALRTVAVQPSATTQASPLRIQYEEALGKLEKAGRDRKLSADELADQGALYVRLGQPAKAVEGKTVPAHGGEQASMLAGVAAFLEEQVLQILAQPGIGAIEMVAAGADDEAFTLGNQQGVGVEELGRQRPAAKPRAARG